MMNNANQLNMDRMNNNLKINKFELNFVCLFVFLPDVCAGIEKLAVDVG